MDGNWEETLVELTVLCKCENIATEFCQRIGESTSKICLGNKAIPLGNRRIILLKLTLSRGNNHLYTTRKIR